MSHNHLYRLNDMQKIFSIVCGLTLLLLSSYANATIVGRVTSVKSTQAPITGVDVWVLNYEIDIVPTTNTAPNPCLNDKNCVIVVGLEYRANDIVRDNVVQMYSKCTEEAKTVGELETCLLTTVGYKFPLARRYNNVSQTPQGCLTLFYGKFGGRDAYPIPGAICGIVPPPGYGCSMPDSLELDHGMVQTSALNGHTVSSQLLISCNTNVSARLYLQSEDGEHINLDKSLSSSLTIDQQGMTATGVPLKLSTGDKTINVSSKLILSGTSPTSGVHSGSGILILGMD